MAILYTNEASTTLEVAINQTVTTVVVNAGDGVKFPSPTGGDYFVIVLEDTNGLTEIMQVTARTLDTFTVVRGFDNSTQRSFDVGTRVELRVTAHTMGAYLDKTGGTMTGDFTIDKNTPTFNILTEANINFNISMLETSQLKLTKNGQNVFYSDAGDNNVDLTFGGSLQQGGTQGNNAGSLTRKDYVDGLVDDLSGVTDAATARTNLDVYSTTEAEALRDTFVNVTGGAPVVSTTGINIASVITETTWESVGPTGSGKDNIWTALDSLPTDIDWIEVRIWHQHISSTDTANTLRWAHVHVRDDGSTQSATTVSRVSTSMQWTDSTGASTSYTTTPGIKIPVTSRAFEAEWESGFNSTDNITMWITGYGHNA